MSTRQPIVLEEIDLYVTMKCNLTCDFCSVKAGEYEFDEELSTQRLLDLITEAHGLGLKELHFSGGEPTLRDDLEQLVEHAHGLGLHTRVITNGYKLGLERLKALHARGLNDLMVSVDGLEATHERMRGKRFSYQRALKVLEQARELGMRTRASTTAFIENRDDVLPLLRLFDTMGLDIYSVFLGSPLGRGQRFRRDSILNAEQWRQLTGEIARVVHDEGLRIDVITEQGFQYADQPQVDRAALQGRGTGCATLMDSFDFLILRSDGKLFQCVFFVPEGAPIGDVRASGLREQLEQARDTALYEPFTRANDRCVSCNEQSACGTGCRGYAFLHTGDWLKTDPRCSKTGQAPAATFPLCPILKYNQNTGRHGGSTEQALRRMPMPT